MARLMPVYGSISARISGSKDHFSNRASRKGSVTARESQSRIKSTDTASTYLGNDICFLISTNRHTIRFQNKAPNSYRMSSYHRALPSSHRQSFPTKQCSFHIFGTQKATLLENQWKLPGLDSGIASIQI